jgi:His-Xaa-Ser system radical SAM maturase HxsB
MKWDDAERAINFMFRSPTRCLKVEFQGGEPLLAFPLIKQFVGRVEEINKTEARNVEFVICSNLSLVSDEILDFCGAHNIYFSTSLDGPRDLHNANRPGTDFDSFDVATIGIARVQNALGADRVSALATTTRMSLAYPVEIVDEYIRQRLNAIFLRPLNPYGLAARGVPGLQYAVEEWLAFYVQALNYILELNYQGLPFREHYAALILRKMLTPYGTGFVDLRSPAGMGIAVILFNHDGGIYASDESRMLAEMGDERFRLGTLSADSYEDVMLSDSLVSLLKDTMAEGVPCCSDCGIQPFCGSDPVRHYRTQGDPTGNKPTSEFCARNMGFIKHLIRLLEDDARAAKVLRSWL